MEKSQHLTIRETWVDTVKILACVLVVLGHFLQSMVKSNILPDNDLYGWFNQTIYYFHVPLFFICSGYLFQKFTSVTNVRQWKNNFLKKFVSLAVPYFVFSLATYIMKTVFSSSVNRESGGLIDTLFLNPTSPYWYLYALVFVFLITVTINNKGKALTFITVALGMKTISFFAQSSIYALETVLENEIWFLAGMLICYYNVSEKAKSLKLRWGLSISIMFIAVSVVVYCLIDWHDVVAFGMGIFGCVSVLLLAMKTEKNAFFNKFTSVLSRYTFPVFLMHTIFAAGLRSVLFKVGISNPGIHIVLGLIISFIGPVIVQVIFVKLKYPEFLLYPNKFFRIGTNNNGKKT